MPGDHPALPVTAAQLASDAVAVVREGAGALHVHPRGADGAETLEPEACDETLLAIRHACPGIPVGLSTAAWIVPDPARRRDLIERWTEWPDFASVNFSEPDGPELCGLLLGLGVGVEAGVRTLGDAEAMLASGYAHRLMRVLVEPQDPEPVAAEAEADRITAALDRANVTPRVYHGYGAGDLESHRVCPGRRMGHPRRAGGHASALRRDLGFRQRPAGGGGCAPRACTRVLPVAPTSSSAYFR